MTADGEITRLLAEWSAGDRKSLDELVELVYGELKAIAAAVHGSATMNPTSVVNELYLRLRAMDGWEWENRKHFYGVAATLMRRLVIDHARQQQAQKRGGNAARVDLDTKSAAFEDSPEARIMLDRALDDLAKKDGRKVKIVELRYFAGLSVEETAEILEISTATVKREWSFAKLWLCQAISGSE
ncbi:MAG: sigma-70 family RNA polymerase sigma factor [Acidobacteria bacterium]|nr:sigma-70 family RNA polymerase sigma factor [Acidobacteriota bacterium]